MRRVVVAVTALLVALGAAVVVSYLLLFSAVADRAVAGGACRHGASTSTRTSSPRPASR